MVVGLTMADSISWLMRFRPSLLEKSALYANDVLRKQWEIAREEVGAGPADAGVGLEGCKGVAGRTVKALSTKLDSGPSSLACATNGPRCETTVGGRL